MSAEGRCCTLLPPIIIVIAAVTDETVNALIHERVLSFVCRLRLGEAITVLEYCQWTTVMLLALAVGGGYWTVACASVSFAEVC